MDHERRNVSAHFHPTFLGDVSAEEQKLRVRRVGCDGRRRYDPESKARLVAACLEPGISISGLALARVSTPTFYASGSKMPGQAGFSGASAKSAFIPVVAADYSLPGGPCSLDLPIAGGGDQPASREKTARQSASSKISAVLPNDVKLTLECGDSDAFTAIIGKRQADPIWRSSLAVGYRYRTR